MDENSADEDQAQSATPQASASNNSAAIRYRSRRAGHSSTASRASQGRCQTTTSASRPQTSASTPDSLGNSTCCCDPASSGPSLSFSIYPRFASTAAAQAPISAPTTFTIPSFHSPSAQSTFLQCRLPATAANARHTGSRHAASSYALTVSGILPSDCHSASFHYSYAIHKGHQFTWYPISG